jgi:hypothetical protein
MALNQMGDYFEEDVMQTDDILPLEVEIGVFLIFKIHIKNLFLLY